MAEGVTFWLENKRSAGIKVCQLGNQILVSYRDRYYVVENGSALTRGGKPLRYSQTSLPTVWKKVMRGDHVTIDTPSPEPEEPARQRVPGKARVKKEKEVTVMPEPTQADTAAILPADKPNQAQAPMFRPARKSAGKPAGQASVAADCPYCNQKHEIPVEKGRSGKPFFQSCTKCKNDFAVRFVQVSMYQAQVAGFR